MEFVCRAGREWHEKLLIWLRIENDKYDIENLKRELNRAGYSENVENIISIFEAKNKEKENATS